MSKTVLVPIADGSEEIEAVCIIDTLRRAGADVTVASVADLTITASRGVKVVADKTMAQCADEAYDLIVLPGGLPGAEHLRDSAELIVLLKKQKQQGRLYAAVCASPAVVFQHHGLLENTRATCYPTMQDQLDENFVSDEPVVVDGNCITGQGPAVAIDFALALVEALFGEDKRKQVATAMLAT